MENSQLSSYELNSGQPPNIPETPLQYPPKYQKQENPAGIWLKSILSLALYLVLGYYVFPSYITLLLITGIVVIHELGHFAAMKFFRYKDLGIFFIPLLGAYVSGTKREVSQKQSAIILLAGPLPGILIGAVFCILDQQNQYQSLFDNDNPEYNNMKMKSGTLKKCKRILWLSKSSQRQGIYLFLPCQQLQWSIFRIGQ